MSTFRKVASEEEITPKRSKVVRLEEFELVLFRVGEEIFAIENLCPHQRFSLFHRGVLDGYTITCPMHSWSFDLRSGKAIMGNGQVKTFEIRLDGNDIWVNKSEFKNKFLQI